MVSLSALVALFGYVTSGPVTFIIVSLVKPQPAWVSAKVFADNYSPVQDLPFYFGFFLIAGMLMLATALYLSAIEPKTRFALLLALCCTVIFCGMVAFNYICQTTYIHNMALNYNSGYDSAIEMFSMSNPLSFCWANEMWGYALLGIATWLMSVYYKTKNETIRILLIANGIVSLISVAWTIMDVNWVLTTLGLVLYFTWNVLMMVIMILIYKHSKNETTSPDLAV